MNPERIQILLSQGRFELAEQEIRQQIGQNIANPVAHLMLGYALMGQQKTKDAILAAKEAIGLAPDFSMAHLLLSEAYYQTGEIKKAKESIQEAIRLDPDESQYFTQQSQLFFYDKNFLG